MRNGARLKITLTSTLLHSLPRPTDSRGGPLRDTLTPYVLVVLQPLQGAHHALFDGELRLPAERSDAGGVEMDKWTVAGPASLPPRVLDLGCDPQMLGDDAHGVVHDDRLLRAEVVDVSPRLLAMALRRAEDRRDAVSDIQVGLLLAPIPEHSQPRGIALQSAVEVEHVPMRIALAEDRDEAADHAGEAIATGIGLDEPLAGELGGRIEGCLDRKGRILGRGEHLGLSVDRAGGSEGDSLDALRAHRLEHARGGDRVLLQIPARMIQAVAHVGIGLEVEDPVTPRDRAVQQGCIEHIPLHERHAVAAQRTCEELAPTGAEVIDDDHLDALGAQAIGEIAPDEAGAAGDANPLHNSHYSVKPAAIASPWNMRTVSSEYCSRFLPRQSSFLSRSWVIVMMWQPI